MKTPTFQEFLNENENIILEKLNLSDDLKTVKTAEDLVKACNGKVLVIHSKHDFRSLKRENISLMWVFWGLGTGNIRVNSYGYMFHGSDIDTIAKERTSYSSNIRITPEDVFEFFTLNKKRGNKIYIADELPVTSDMKTTAADIDSNNSAINALLTADVTETVGGKNVFSPSYVIFDKGSSHGSEYFEFSVDGKDYTYYRNVYSYDPTLSNGRKTAKAGWGSRDQRVYKVDKKTVSKILSLVQDNLKIFDNAKKTLLNYYKREDINPY